MPTWPLGRWPRRLRGPVGWSHKDAPNRLTQDRPFGGRPIPPPILRLFDRDGKLNAEEEARFREDLRMRQAGGGQDTGRPADTGIQRPLPGGTQAYRDVHYGPHETRNLYDLYIPKSDKPLPLVIWIHGGGRQNGNKGGGPALALLEQGFAVATIDYRLSSDAIFPAQMRDCKAAVRHLRAKAMEYGIDPKRFGVWGSSAGGHLVALVGTLGDVKEIEGDVGEFTSVSSREQTVCDWYGPTDFLKMGGRHDDAQSPESKLIGGPIQRTKSPSRRPIRSLMYRPTIRPSSSNTVIRTRPYRTTRANCCAMAWRRRKFR